MSEFNNIIEIIAPCRIKQEQKNYTPYITKVIRYKQRKLRKLYEIDKRSKNNEDWLKYKNTKAALNKEIAQSKKTHMLTNLTTQKTDGKLSKILIALTQ